MRQKPLFLSVLQLNIRSTCNRAGTVFAVGMKFSAHCLEGSFLLGERTTLLFRGESLLEGGHWPTQPDFWAGPRQFAPGLVCAQAPMHDWHGAHLRSSTEPGWIQVPTADISLTLGKEKRGRKFGIVQIYLTLVSAKQLEISLEVAISLLSNLYLVRLIYQYGMKWISENNKMNTLFRESL